MLQAKRSNKLGFFVAALYFVFIAETALILKYFRIVYFYTEDYSLSPGWPPLQLIVVSKAVCYCSKRVVCWPYQTVFNGLLIILVFASEFVSGFNELREHFVCRRQQCPSDCFFFFQMLAGVLLILHFPHTHARTVWHDHHTHPLHGIITHNSFDVTNNNQRTAEVIFQWCILRVYRDPNGTTLSHEQLSEMEMELRFTRSNNNPRWSRHAKLHVNYMLIRSHFLLNLSFCKRRKTKIREEKFGKKLSTSKLTACAKHSCIFHIRFANHSLWIMNFVDENCDGKKVFVWILFAVNVWALWIVIKYSEVYFSVVLQQRHVRVDTCLRRWNDDSVDENIYIKMYLHFLGALVSQPKLHENDMEFD